MANISARSRKQFSSCDSCRLSRVSCDASKKSNLVGTPAWQDSCSRCAKKGRRCTFDWMNTRKKGPVRDECSATATPTAGFSANPNQAVTINREVGITLSPFSSATSIHQGLWQIYQRHFEALFGIWLGFSPCLDGYDLGSFCCRQSSSSCNDPTKRGTYPNTICISQLCIALDKWISEGQGAHHYVANRPSGSRDTDPKEEQQINLSLVKAIHCFSVRWLYLLDSAAIQRTQPLCYDALARQFWRTTRRDMLKVINQTSYRSVLTLLLFGMTPLPVGLDEQEEVDGLSGQLCMQIALGKLHELRARQKTCQFSGFKVLPSVSPGPLNTIADGNTAMKFIGAESAAYYAGMIFDTSASLTLNSRSLLSSGLLGFDTEPVFRLVKTQSRIFHENTEEWRQSDFEVSNENTSRITVAAGTWKLFVWKMIAVFKEALRDGYDDEVVGRVYTAVLDAINQFRITYRPLMAVCERGLQFLDWRPKFEWYNIMLHYHMGILILLDAIEAAGRTDLLPKLEKTRTESEQGVINTLKFGLEARCPVQVGHRMSNAVTQTIAPSIAKGTVSFIAIDPYSHHIVASTQLVSKAIIREYRTGRVGTDAFVSLRETLVTALQHLPDCSRSVQIAREQLRRTMFEATQQPSDNSHPQTSFNIRTSLCDNFSTDSSHDQEHIVERGTLLPDRATDLKRLQELITEINTAGLNELTY